MKKKKKIPSPSLTDCCLFSPLHFHSVKTSSRYLALRLKSIAVSPGRYRWQCCCAAAESSEHLEGWIQLQLIPSPAPGQAMDSASKPRSPTRNPNQVFAVSVYFVYPRPSLSGSSAVHRQLEFLFCGRDTVWESWEGGGGTVVSGRLQIKSFFLFSPFFFFLFFLFLFQMVYRGEGLPSKAADRTEATKSVRQVRPETS